MAAIALASPAAAVPVRGQPFVMPEITAASSPAPETVEISWIGVQGPTAIIWQNGHTTRWPNTGHAVIRAAYLTVDRVEVCEVGPSTLVCSPTVTVTVAQ